MVFDYEKVKNPEYFSEGQVEAHSNHKYYGSRDFLEQGEENFKYSLNGLWKFHYAKIIPVPFRDLNGKTIAARPGMI